RTAADGYGIEVLQRRALSKTSAIFLVNAGGRLLVLGSSAQSVQLLADLGEGHPDEDAEDPFDAAALLGIPDTVPADYASYLDTKRSPRTAAPALPAGSATAWEAIMTTLRERTVRR
ncbi:MAG: hypothetical protein JWM85_3438, partial [Acidimicrobiaceae bacterium]|nr:hypothetical protein [Acidimicrobiaceae bacterium]